jgi:hypothetical protein
MSALIFSGLTAIPIKWEIARLGALFALGTPLERVFPPLAAWLSHIHLRLDNITPDKTCLTDMLFHLFTDQLEPYYASKNLLAGGEAKS